MGDLKKKAMQVATITALWAVGWTVVNTIANRVTPVARVRDFVTRGF